MSFILDPYEIFGSRGLPKCLGAKNQGKNQMCDIDLMPSWNPHKTCQFKKIICQEFCEKAF
jgi:hypothetical protein